MNLMSLPYLESFWSGDLLHANLVIGMNLLGALMLGMLVGYERSYHGRAAGMRTYGLVCMASTALTVFVGFAKFWYGGSAWTVNPDPTRVVQGVVSGIGFLCAGVIMKDGLSISGLTTAASIWAAAAIGILLGVGFYFSALFLALLCAVSMSFMHRLELLLPSRTTMGVVLTFREGFVPKEPVLARVAAARGYELVRSSLSITFDAKRPVWKFLAVAHKGSETVSAALLAEELSAFDGVVSFSLQPARS